MARFLLACPCGKQVAVEDGQAGDQVRCACGKMLDVPTLRKLRHLPPLEVEAPHTSSTWTLRHGIMTLAFLFTLGSGALGVFFLVTTPKIPKFDPEDRAAYIEQRIENLTPAEAWAIWITNYRGLAKTGFSEYRAPNEEVILLARQQHRLYYVSFFSAAGVSLLVALGALWSVRNMKTPG